MNDKNIKAAKLFFDSRPNETECLVYDGQVWNAKDKGSAELHLAKLKKQLTKVTIQEVKVYEKELAEKETEPKKVTKKSSK